MASSRNETFFGKANWEQAQHESQGYEAIDLVTALTTRAELDHPWSQIKDRLYLQAREIELLNALQTIALLSGNSQILDVADVGGGNGYMAAVARQFMPSLQFPWTVFESGSVANSYQRFEPEADIFWKENSEQNFDHVFDVAIISCALHYIPEPHTLLNFLSTTSRYLLLMRLPLVDDPADIPTIQRPSDGLYATVNAQWPAWFLSRSRFDDCLEEVGDVIFRWTTPTEVWQFEGEPIMLEGVLLKTKVDDG